MVTGTKIELKGRIVRWDGKAGWGIVNFYPENSGSSAPHKAFLHKSKIVSNEKPELGACVIFDLGPGRSPSELPAALNARIIRNAEAL